MKYEFTGSIKAVKKLTNENIAITTSTGSF